jgi:hypothetical protein
LKSSLSGFHSEVGAFASFGKEFETLFVCACGGRSTKAKTPKRKALSHTASWSISCFLPVGDPMFDLTVVRRHWTRLWLCILAALPVEKRLIDKLRFGYQMSRRLL